MTAEGDGAPDRAYLNAERILEIRPLGGGATVSPRSSASWRMTSSSSSDELGRHVDHDLDEQVAAAAPLEVRDAPAAQAERRARRGAPRDLDLLGAVERLEVERGAERGLGVGQVHGA